jgi:hypothetical protein
MLNESNKKVQAKKTGTNKTRSHARSSISSSVFSKSYLAKAWEARSELLDYERRGFAQFFYLTICGHIESQLASVISGRLTSIYRTINWDDLPPFQLGIDGVDHKCSLEPVTRSLRQIARHVEGIVDDAPLGKLMEIFAWVFPEKLRDLIGSELHEDMIALADLRNIFAHGRQIFMDFYGEDFSELRGSLDGNPLKTPANRLLKVGIIKNLEITGQNHNDFYAVFYGDDAMLHFYRAANSIEEKLEANSTFLPERYFKHSKLPSLKP